jgi:hypothetical protein
MVSATQGPFGCEYATHVGATAPSPSRERKGNVPAQLHVSNPSRPVPYEINVLVLVCHTSTSLVCGNLYLDLNMMSCTNDHTRLKAKVFLWDSKYDIIDVSVQHWSFVHLAVCFCFQFRPLHCSLHLFVPHISLTCFLGVLVLFVLGILILIVLSKNYGAS